METVVIYPGRFHPFHAGHKSSYNFLTSKFGKNNVFVATTSKQAPITSPFSYEEKQVMMTALGIPADKIVQVRNPYNAEEIIKNFYPLDFCIVTGNDLGDMGGPVSYDHNGTLIKFCCKPCIPKFEKNPAKYLVLLREELEAEKATSLENNSS